MNAIDEFFSLGHKTGKEYMSYVTAGKNHIVTIIPNSMLIVSDKNGNLKQNLQFEGKITRCEINSRVVIETKSKIIFPLISFRSALFRFYESQKSIKDFLKSRDSYKVVFNRHTQRNYEIISIQKESYVEYGDYD